MLQSASRGGVCLLPGGGVCSGGCLLLGGLLWGVCSRGSAPGGVCSGGVSAPGGGVGGCLLRGGGWCIPACTEADTLSPCGQNSWHTLVKILPWPNFVAAGNDPIVDQLQFRLRWQSDTKFIFYVFVFVDEGECQDANCAKIKSNILTKLVSVQQQEVSSGMRDASSFQYSGSSLQSMVKFIKLFSL